MSLILQPLMKPDWTIHGAGPTSFGVELTGVVWMLRLGVGKSFSTFPVNVIGSASAGRAPSSARIAKVQGNMLRRTITSLLPRKGSSSDFGGRTPGRPGGLGDGNAPGTLADGRPGTGRSGRRLAPGGGLSRTIGSSRSSPVPPSSGRMTPLRQDRRRTQGNGSGTR